MKEFCRKEIEFQVLKLTHKCSKMIEIMKECHQEVEITDMTNIRQSENSHTARKTMRSSGDYGATATISLKDESRLLYSTEFVSGTAKQVSRK